MGGKAGRQQRIVTRIDTLTDEQAARFVEWRDKWIKIGLCTDPANRARFERAARDCYHFAGLAEPQRIVWVESPIVLALVGPIASCLLADGAVHGAVRDAVDGAVRDAVDDAVGDAVHGAVRDAVGGAVHGAVDGAVRDAVGGAVRDAVDGAVHGAVDGAVRDAVGGAVRGAVDGAVRDAVGGAVHGAVGGAVRGAVGGAVHGAVGGAVRGAWNYYMGGQFWVGGWWGSPAFVSFFRDVCGLQLPGDMDDRARAYQATCESACWWWPHRDFVIACDRPRVISRDDRGRLHSETGKAIEFRDGWGISAWHGTVVPDEWISNRGNLGAEDRIDRSERRTPTRRCRDDRVAPHPRTLPNRTIDADPDPQIGTLIAVDLPDAPDSRFLRVRCATGRDFALPVPREVTTALAANAWTYGIEPLDLKQLQARS